MSMTNNLSTTPTPYQALADADSERRLLGILIKHPNYVDSAVERLRAEHFVDPVHRQIYQAILDLYTLGGRISYTQLFNRLRKDGSIPSLEKALLDLTEALDRKSTRLNSSHVAISY